MSKLFSSKFLVCAVIVHNAVQILGLLLCCETRANAIMQRKQCQLGQKQFWHVLPNWLLCSHPLPDMNDQCTKWSRIIMLSCTGISFVISFFNFEEFGVKPGFPSSFFYSHCICIKKLHSKISYMQFDKKFLIHIQYCTQEPTPPPSKKNNNNIITNNDDNNK